MAAISGAYSLARGEDGCVEAARIALANAADLEQRATQGADIQVAITVRGQTAQAKAGPILLAVNVTNAPSSLSAPALSSGWLPLPHFGDCTQDGQPDSQGQERTASKVAAIHSGKRLKPSSAKP